MADLHTMTPSRPGTQPRSPDELAVPTFVVGAAVTRGRRAMARARRLPGLSLLVVGALRGIARTTNPHVPALPWSVGLSPSLLWSWASPSGERAAPSTAPSPASRAGWIEGGPVSALVTSGRGVSVDRSDERTALSAAAVMASTSSTIAAFGPIVRGILGAVGEPVGGRAGHTARPVTLPASQGRIAVASRPSPNPGSPAASSEHVATPRSSTPVDAERSAPVRSLAASIGLEANAPSLALVRSTLGAAPRAAVANTAATPASALPARRPDRRLWGFTLDVATRSANAQGDMRPAQRNAQLRARSGAPPLELPARAAPPLASTDAHLASTDALPWPDPTPAAAASPDVRVVRTPHARRASMLTEHRAPGDALLWSTPAMASSIVPANQDLRPLPAREPNGGPVALATLVEVTQMMRTLVAREAAKTGEAREIRLATTQTAQRPAHPPTHAIPNDDDARMLLRRMRSLAQEERFRSGMLR